MAEIAVIHPGFTGELGGAKAVSFHIASALQKDHNVTHIVEFDLSDEEVEERFKVSNYDQIENRQIKAPKTLKLWNSIPRFSLVKASRRNRPYAKLYREIKDDYDYIFFTSPTLDFEQFAEDEKDLFGEKKNTLIYYHGWQVSNEELNNRNFVYKKIINSGGKIANFRGEKNFFNSSFSRQRSSVDGKIIYPPVPSEFEYTPEGSGLCCLARISPEKNMEDAIEISRRTGLELTIVGFLEDEKYFKKLKDLAHNNVNFKPDASREDINYILKNSMFGLNCGTWSEHFGIVTVEYMKAGVIPFVRHAAANKEVVEKEELQWDSIDDAVRKLKSLEKTPEIGYKYIKTRKDDFGKQKFHSQIRTSFKKYSENQ